MREEAAELEAYDPVWDYDTPEEAQAAREAQGERGEETGEIPPSDQETDGNSILSMRAEDGTPVILVQQMQRDSPRTSPVNVARRLVRSVASIAGFVATAVAISLIASLAYNALAGAGTAGSVLGGVLG